MLLLLIVAEFIGEVYTELAVSGKMHSEMLINIIDGRRDAAALKKVIAVKTENGMLSRKLPTQTHVNALTTAEIIDSLDSARLRLS